MFEDFHQPPSERWTRTAIGGASLESVDAALRMHLGTTSENQYADAQIDDYGTLTRAQFPWRPPLLMEVVARASLPAATASSDVTSTCLHGTAGFGFWNYPFSVRGDILMLPEAIWFFYASPPSNMALVPGSPGWGWKAQVVHSMRTGALFSTLPLALSMPLALLTGEMRPAARWLQRLSGAHEQILDVDLTTRQNYALEWRTREVIFQVNGQEVLRVPDPPTRPLGFVAWLDNQFAIATPRGKLRFGTVSSQPQWFEIANLRIEPL